MKREWSTSWVSSTQPRKQRKYRANAPNHKRRNMMSAHLSRVLRKEFGRRAVKIRKGDEVKVVRGEKKGSQGKIIRVDFSRMKIYVENVKGKKVSGQEVEIAIDPSNVVITRLDMDDKARAKSIKKSKKPVQTAEKIKKNE